MTTYINASCACELNAFRVAFDTASLPIVNDLCHCNTCRHSSGQMAVSHVTIRGVPYTRLHESGSRTASRSGYSSDDGERNRIGFRNIPNGQLFIQRGLLVPPTIAITEPEPSPYALDDLKTYNTSPDVTRYFCASCSAHLFWIHHKDSGDSWAVSVGALHKTEGVVKIGYHIWVGDTLDGGLADHLRAIDGKEIPRYKGDMGSDQLPEGWRAPSIAGAQDDAKEDDQLRGFCLCRTIEFAITRPSESSTLLSSSYPDLLCAYDVSHLSKIANTRDEKWWLRPTGSSTPTKYLAGYCMCATCRLSSGFEIQSWAFIPLINIVKPGTTTPLCLEIEEERPQGLKQYISSPGRYRESCGTCGATIFMWQAGVPDLVWVSVGLLDEKVSGARAENWLEWHKARVGFREKALSRAVAKGLELGLKN